ncbi:hypothetical protein [Salirhabdus sp. Marseille-P4669]|uniref:hypothetical protein n=1 Tax=Salirhabdus sp. Marseille-P4669 TaxID=2042310 RepID=UPI0011AFBC33|nr:hypothetical protein [Salirhabdus sp. Marseille-P4669]
MNLIELALQGVEQNESQRKPKPLVKSKGNQSNVSKGGLSFGNEKDNLAYQSGWLVGLSGEIYEIPISRFTSLYIFKNDEDRFDVVRLKWKKEGTSPFLEIYRAENVHFEKALDIGNNYLQWIKSNKR